MNIPVPILLINFLDAVVSANRVPHLASRRALKQQLPASYTRDTLDRNGAYVGAEGAFVLDSTWPSPPPPPANSLRRITPITAAVGLMFVGFAAGVLLIALLLWAKTTWRLDWKNMLRLRRPVRSAGEVAPVATGTPAAAQPPLAAPGAEADAAATALTQAGLGAGAGAGGGPTGASMGLAASPSGRSAGLPNGSGMASVPPLEMSRAASVSRGPGSPPAPATAGAGGGGSAAEAAPTSWPGGSAAEAPRSGAAAWPVAAVVRPTSAAPSPTALPASVAVARGGELQGGGAAGGRPSASASPRRGPGAFPSTRVVPYAAV